MLPVLSEISLRYDCSIMILAYFKLNFTAQISGMLEIFIFEHYFSYTLCPWIIFRDNQSKWVSFLYIHVFLK